MYLICWDTDCPVELQGILRNWSRLCSSQLEGERSWEDTLLVTRLLFPIVPRRRTNSGRLVHARHEHRQAVAASTWSSHVASAINPYIRRAVAQLRANFVRRSQTRTPLALLSLEDWKAERKGIRSPVSALPFRILLHPLFSFPPSPLTTTFPTGDPLYSASLPTTTTPSQAQQPTR